MAGNVGEAGGVSAAMSTLKSTFADIAKDQAELTKLKSYAQMAIDINKTKPQ